MHKRLLFLFIIPITLCLSRQAVAQSYHNDFENGNPWLQPWGNIHILDDSTAHSGNRLCLCDSIHEFGLGFQCIADEAYPDQNIHLQFDAWFRNTFNNGETLLVTSINDSTSNRYWNSYPLSAFANDSADWFPVKLDLHFPHDYLKGSTLKFYIWNPNRNVIHIDDVQLTLQPTLIPNYLPAPFEASQSDKPLVINDKDGNPLTYPIYFVSEWDNRNETAYLSQWDSTGNNIWQCDDSLCRTIINLCQVSENHIDFNIECHFKQGGPSLRQALVIPFIDSTMRLYKRNLQTDTADFQSAYYLDREGFVVGEGERSIATYHNIGISSLQFDAEHRAAIFNIDYCHDHPLIHYPLDNDTADYFIDLSCRAVQPDDVIRGHFSLFVGSSLREMPRIMPVWDGYESAFIFTEHADWTDIRTHRAVLYGNEHITRPEEAVGGFVYFGIPVTKSVFFNNPDHVTNYETTHGDFAGEHATVTTDKAFFNLLKDLHRNGFDICLHTPEQYTTVGDNLSQALRFMRRNFGSTTWIDHGYNNSAQNNRENLVCDALLPEAPQYAAKLWKQNGIRYLWNAYFEENRMDSLNFDGHFGQPYDGFSEALPNRQITTLPDDDPDFLLWATPSTLEVNQDRSWYYFFDTKRLQHIVDNHKVFITHTYPAWTDPYRAFWQYNDDSTAVAMPGFNFALQQLSDFRAEKKILPTTVRDYLHFHEGLLAVEYRILDNGDIQLINKGEAIHGFTLRCLSPVVVEGKIINFRKVGDEYLIWFDLNRNETTKIHFQ